VIDSFVLDYEKWFSGRGGRIPKIGAADKAKFLKEGLPELPPVASVLGATNKAWLATTTSHSYLMPGEKYKYSEMTGRYRVAHLIIYYFLHLDGEAGISKLCRYVDRKRQIAASFAAYRAAFAEYERKLEEFMKLPGVERMDDGRFTFPQSLTPPRAPISPLGSADGIESSGMEILFADDAPEALGSKIEDSLRKDLELPLRFTMKVTK
jgi:hypothetical protein